MNKYSIKTNKAGVPTRFENFSIQLDLSKEEYLSVEKEITALCGFTPAPQEGDVLTFDYTFWAEYFGLVEERLNQVLTIIEKAAPAVVKVDSNLLDGTTCLIARVVEKLQQMQLHLKSKIK